MKRILLIGILLLSSDLIKAQTYPDTNYDRQNIAFPPIKHDPHKLYKIADKVPEPPGGAIGWAHYLKRNLRHPKNGVKGRVIVSFIVERDGRLTNIFVIKKLSPEADEDALRIIKDSPKWSPGMYRGYRVRLQYSLPINFN